MKKWAPREKVWPTTSCDIGRAVGEQRGLLVRNSILGDIFLGITDRHLSSGVAGEILEGRSHFSGTASAGGARRAPGKKWGHGWTWKTQLQLRLGDYKAAAATFKTTATCHRRQARSPKGPPQRLCGHEDLPEVGSMGHGHIDEVTVRQQVLCHKKIHEGRSMLMEAGFVA